MILYIMTVRDNGRLIREWQTTSCLTAMGFVTTFMKKPGERLGLFSTPYDGAPIPHVQQTIQP